MLKCPQCKFSFAVGFLTHLLTVFPKLECPDCRTEWKIVTPRKVKIALIVCMMVYIAVLQELMQTYPVESGVAFVLGFVIFIIAQRACLNSWGELIPLDRLTINEMSDCCPVCGKRVDNDAIMFDDINVCVGCKEGYVQMLKEGVE